MPYKPAPGGGGLTTWGETFHRADQAWFLGDDWYTCQLAAGTLNPQTLALVTNVSAGVKAVLGLAGQGVTADAVFIPRKLDYTRMYRRSQYSEFRFLSFGNGAVSRIGPATHMTPNFSEGNGYMAGLLGDVAKIRLERSIPASIDLGAAFSVVANDVVRIETVLGVAGNLVSLYINGVLKNTILDAAAGFPTGGMPGIAFESTGASQTVSFDNFDCGVL